MGLTKKITHEILRDLLDNPQGIYVFQLPSKYKIQVNEVFPFIEKYKNWIHYSGGKIKLYDYSIGAVKLALNAVCNKDNKSNVLIGFMGDQISIGSPYVPQKLRTKTKKSKD